ncbi:MAG TPA: hypothetical protein VGN63_07035 [Flavisolibacter sp.]|jgi:hypothetical protein|nr:hypothetical protein [Flavisolibacter sp.]
MKVRGIKGLTVAQVQNEIARGGRFVQYTWCVSLLVVTFRYPSAVYFIRRDENAFVKGLPFTIITLLLGWWGIPYGVFYTLRAIYTNIEGKCVTEPVMKHLYRQTGGHVFEFEATRKVAFA